MTVKSQLNQTLATLTSAQSTLKTYAIETTEKETKEAYEQALEITATIIENLQSRIQDLEFQEPQYKGN